MQHIVNTQMDLISSESIVVLKAKPFLCKILPICLAEVTVTVWA